MTEPIATAESQERPWILLEVTRRCNFHCAYCYASKRLYDEELSVGALERILERLTVDVNPNGISLIGGEPLLVAGVEDLVRCIHERGIVTAISTKGSCLDGAAVAGLKRAGLDSVELSFDSIEPAVYERLTGTSMSRVQGTLVALVQSGISVTVGAMLTRVNLDRLEELLELCFVLGVKRVSLNQMAQVGSGAINRSIGLCDEELALALDRASACARALGLRVGVGLPVEPCRLSRERFIGLDFESCGCGDRKWLIEPSGNVRTCELAPAPIGNILQNSWRDLVASEAAARFRQQKRDGRCGECEYWSSCRGGCRFRCSGD